MNNDPHKTEIFALCDVIRETSFEIYKYLRSGGNKFTRMRWRTG